MTWQATSARPCHPQALDGELQEGVTGVGHPLRRMLERAAVQAQQLRERHRAHRGIEPIVPMSSQIGLSKGQ